jgi:purine-binding chemotaxis protein CheW
MHLLVFTLDDQRFALPATVVHETVAAVAVTPLPAAPAVVDGVVDVRGELVPVYDLRVRFGRPRRPVRADEHFVIASAGRRTVALRVDRALELVEVSDRDLLPARPDDPRMARVAGIARLPDGLVLVQDLEEFLSDSEAATLDEALREHARSRSSGTPQHTDPPPQ